MDDTFDDGDINIIETGLNDKKDTEVILNPWYILGLNEDAKFQQIRVSFIQQISSQLNEFATRRLIALSFDMFTKERSKCYKFINNGKYEVKKKDQFYYCIVGNCEMIKEKNYSDKQLYEDEDECKRTCLYLTAKNGHYELTKYLLDRLKQSQQYNLKNYVNKIQKNGSTCLHASTFYGQNHIIILLLAYKADPSIKNQYKNTPFQEAKNDRIKQILQDNEKDKISEFFQQNKQLLVKLEKKTFGYRLRRKIEDSPLDKLDENELKDKYIQSFHGTQKKYLQSIIKLGLRKPVEKNAEGEQIDVVPGHIKRNIEVDGIKDWAGAIFVSPSPFYASDKLYSEKIQSMGKTYCIIIETFVKKNTYHQFKSTILKRELKKLGEMVNVEFRVEDKPQDDDTLFRISSEDKEEQNKNLITAGVLFIEYDFLDDNSKDQKQDYQSILNHFK